MKTTKQKRGEKTRRIELMLLSGRKLTKKWLDRTLDLTNSAENVRQLKNRGMPIRTDWKVSENGIRYGVYSYDPPKKQSRISTRQYLDQAYSKKI